MSRDPGCGVVLSGGGAKGAYEIGVLKALAAGLVSSTGGQPLRPMSTGTSVGAYNATLLAGQEEFPRAVAHLEKLWTEKIAGSLESCGNGVFRLRSGPLRFLQPGCALHPVQSLREVARDAAFWTGFTAKRMAETLFSDQPLGNRLADWVDFTAFFSPSPMEELIRTTVPLKELARSSAELRFAATDWIHGQALIFDGDSLQEEDGLAALMGSAALPGIFPPVDYRHTTLVDGGLVMNTPLKPALKAGATELHVIYLDPFVAEIPLERQVNSLESLYRTYTILLGTSVRQEFVTVNQINQQVQMLRALRAQTASLSRTLQASLRPLLARAMDREDQDRAYQEVTLHRYRPRTDMGGGIGVLDFRLSNVRDLIEQGFEDAVAHDCDLEGCVLPGEEKSRQTLEDGRERQITAP